MSRPDREHLAFVLFFPALAYVIAYGWDAFVRAGAVGQAWLHLVVPALSMTVALVVWPQPA